ncbi:hypothetical protein KIW84_060448 [Lathyrus oleraceus]|uniref:BURP domain-containing protein n=1 Tax=Pisum sativum TaxID=3888 RepID=A0A9D4VZR8_PEA|nr:hypothetical protein KIW84_060448 [Pisum sativum]
MFVFSFSSSTITKVIQTLSFFILQPYGISHTLSWFCEWPHHLCNRLSVTDSIWLENKERQSLDDFCNSPTAIGEHKHCVSSLESMIDHVISHFRTSKIKAISSTFDKNEDQYVVEEVKKVGENAVMCHRLNFKKVVFNCHQVRETTAYVVSLAAPDGSKAKALTVCHHDTRGMNPELLYEALKVSPGTVSVCHFIGNKAAAWVPNYSVDRPCVI